MVVHAPRKHELKVCRQTARQQQKDALRFIAEKKLLLAVTRLIEADMAQSEAAVLARVAEWDKDRREK